MTSARERSWTVQSSMLFGAERLDAKYFNNEGIAAYATVSALRSNGVEVRRLGQDASVWDPSRFARVWATSDEPAVGYLRPYDVFEYLPMATQKLSIRKNSSIDDLRIRAGQILQTCSGRNLGPLTYADSYLSSFALSHDMIRIEVKEIEERMYIYAFLQASLGQSLLRRDTSGSVISHLTVKDVEALPIPRIGQPARAEVVDLMSSAVSLRETARQYLVDALVEVERQLPEDRPNRRAVWTARALELTDRLDAASRSPGLAELRAGLAARGGSKLAEIAKPTLPPRYKRYYVDAGFGRPIVAGRQVVQAQPVNLQYLADRSFKDPDRYVLKAGCVVFGADGRAEGLLGWPALVGIERDGWLANNNIMRLEPLGDTRPGALWLSVACKQVQSQIKALSFGSVVDHTIPEDVGEVIVPRISDELASNVEWAWSAFDRATAKSAEAVSRLDAALSAMSG